MARALDAAERPFVVRPQEIAAFLGLSLSRTYNLLAAGVLPAKRVGGRWYVFRPGWEEFKRTAGMELLRKEGVSEQV